MHFYSSEMVYLGIHIQMGILGTDIGTMGVKKSQIKGKGLMPYFNFLLRPKTKKHILFASLVHFFSLAPLLSFFGLLFWILLTPSMAMCAPKVPIWHWVPRCTLLDDQSAKKRAHSYLWFLFLDFWVPKKSHF